MARFIIDLCPSVPEPEFPPPAISLTDIDYRKVLEAIPQNYDIRYVINGRIFCYYPSSILTVLNDLNLEWDLARKRESHEMTLSGYTVLQIVFDGERARFYDPVERAEDKKGPIGEFEATYIENAFRTALEAVWFLVRKAG